jgi:hypothetical protein
MDKFADATGYGPDFTNYESERSMGGKIEKCDACGDPHPKLMIEETGGSYIECTVCGMTGETFGDAKEAIEDWNAEYLLIFDEPETGTTPDSECTKFSTGAKRSKDANGVRYDLISVVGLRRLAARYALGAVNYGDDNWRKGFPYSDVINHLQNHLELFKEGDTSDDNLAAIAWGAFTLMDFEENMPEMDDRWATKRGKGK